MIELRNLVKCYRLNGVTKYIARNINCTFPTGRSVALMGLNGAGKSSMLKMIAGTLEPDSGEIVSNGTISWPVGFSGSFHGDMTGAQNVKFVARIYGVDTDEMVRFCGDFAELESHYFLPVRTYSSGMRSRLAFAMSMAIPFDTYLIDEITAVGDASFKKKSEALLRDRLRQSAAIFVSHSTEQMERMCQSGAVLQEGRMFYYNDVKKASEHYSYTIKRELPPWLRKKKS
jgi:capsular polysaccharide transport system ATP-binding protein